ncbi:MAG: glycosyltransferase family 4 protein [Fidelibacterota bacterium]|nr:MAG: glycosyltransferase family 4 protein [Candidatus Neomarinimicrobiota bacterium]
MPKDDYFHKATVPDMKILIFEQRYTSEKDPGIARFNIFAKYWAREAHSVTVVSGMINYVSGHKPHNYKRKIFFPERIKKGITVLRVFDTVIGYSTFLGRMFSYFTYTFSSLCAGITIKRPDLIIVSSPPLFVGIVAIIISALKKIPFIFDVRDPWPVAAVELGFVKNRILIRLSYLLENYIYRKSSHTVVNSSGMLKYLITEKGVTNKKIGLIPNPVDFETLNSNKPKLWEKNKEWEKKFIIMYSGAHSAIYDFDTLLSVAESFDKNSEILFVLIGDGRQKQYIHEYINKHDIKNVLLLPPVTKTEITKHINNADICLVPVKHHKFLQYCFFTKLFDYMALKKPIVIAAEGASARLVVDEANCGIAVNPGNKEAFENAILELYQSKEKRKVLGGNGYRYVSKNISAEKLAQDYIKIIESIEQ